MIDFEEELKKFHPSLEVSDAEDAIHNHDVSDMMDILFQLLDVKKKNSDQESFLEDF